MMTENYTSCEVVFIRGRKKQYNILTVKNDREGVMIT